MSILRGIMGFYKKQAEIDNLGLNPTVPHTTADLNSAKEQKSFTITEKKADVLVVEKEEEKVIKEEILVKNALKSLEDEDSVQENKILGEFVEKEAQVLTDSKVTKKQKKVQQD